VYYLNRNGQFLNSKEGADIMRIVIKPKPPEKYYTVHEFNILNKLIYVGQSSKDDGSVSQGAFITYYPNGKRSVIGNFKDGSLSGMYTDYYENGKLKRTGKADNQKGQLIVDEFRDSAGVVLATGGKGTGINYYEKGSDLVETGPIVKGLMEGEWHLRAKDTLKCTFFYHEGKMTSGIGYDSLGNGYPFEEIKTAPMYNKSSSFVIYRTMYEKVLLTKAAKEHNVTGSVTINFLVKLDGSITDIKITKSLGYGIDEEAIEAVKATSGNWNPAKLYGIPMETTMSFSFVVH